jgi:hypothetical protein
MCRIRNKNNILVEMLGRSRYRFGDNIRIDIQKTGYEVANLFQISNTDCCEHELIINSRVSYVVEITFYYMSD